MIKDLIRSSLRSIGYDVKKYPDPELKSRQLAMKTFGINKIFDVGANAGQFAKIIRSEGFKGTIISFEPLSSAFKELKKNSASDLKWTVHNMAIGDVDGNITIHVAGNSFSSSIREMLPTHLENASESRYISDEQVDIRKLDSIFYEYYESGDNILLKIDTQGYEKNVIDGALKSLENIKGVSLEMSLVQLYNGEMLFWEMAPLLESKGFKLYSIESEFTSPSSGQLLQVNGIFYKG